MTDLIKRHTIEQYQVLVVAASTHIQSGKSLNAFRNAGLSSQSLDNVGFTGHRRQTQQLLLVHLQHSHIKCRGIRTPVSTGHSLHLRKHYALRKKIRGILLFHSCLCKRTEADNSCHKRQPIEFHIIYFISRKTMSATTDLFQIYLCNLKPTTKVRQYYPQIININ